jgi:predicted AlkP superfamily phosphohydrolase/phosphomutase
MTFSGHKDTIDRRAFLHRAGAATLAAGGVFSIGRAQAQASGRVIMLGFDGVEPRVVEDMLGRGELPNLAKLRGQGGFYDLISSIPPQSPVAWNSFGTCKNPGGHNIFDFIRRDPRGRTGPMPYVGTGKVEPPRFGPDGAVIDPARGITYRKGTPFWSVADAQGRKSKIINVPFVFPADPMKNGLMICGLGVPDLRGTTNTYFSLSDKFDDARLKEDISGGQRARLVFDGAGTAVFAAPGPRNTQFAYGDPRAYATTDIKFQVDRKGGRGKAESGGKTVELVPGQWSDWLELHYQVTGKYAVEGITRFYPFEIGEAGVRLYMACTQFHPKAPYVPYSAPDEFSEAVAERLGLFKTVGWSFDTHALRQGDLDEDAFLKDVEQTMAWHEKLALDELDRSAADLFIAAWTATDRVGHMFWRFRDPKHPLYDGSAPERFAKALEMTYKKADEITGKVMARLKEGDTLFVLSDHGFGSWRTGFDLNAWLRDNGYLSVSDPARAAKGFLQGIDWAKTRAYSVGISSLYLNLRGRETAGCVDPAEADRTAAELRDKLLQVKDPATGVAVFTDLHLRGVYKGEAIADAPDMSLGYNTAYQSDKNCAKGGVGDKLFSPNDDKWSGEHAATEYTLCPGMLFSNRKLAKDKPHIQDLGVTALKLMGADVPGDYEGDGIV